MAAIEGLDPALKWLYHSLIGEVKPDNPELLKKKVIEELSVEIAGLLSESKQNTPPFKPELLARVRKVKQIVSFNSREALDGLLVPVEGGFVIKLNSNAPPTRYRFACAHEIGHTFFYDLNHNPPVKPYPTSQSSYWVEEGIARRIAGEILMPEFSVKRIIKKFGKPSLEAFKKISDLYFVSYESLARRLFWDLKLWDALFLISDVVDRKLIKINNWNRFMGASFKNGLKIPRVISPESEQYSNLYSNLNSALERMGEMTSIKPITLADERYFIQSICTRGYGGRVKQRIFSIVSRDEPPLETQQLNFS